jgi:hypothetical protein
MLPIDVRRLCGAYCQPCSCFAGILRLQKLFDGFQQRQGGPTIATGRGAELHYRPPYSPDLNPIENAFAKLKAHVRKSAARTFDALERAAANALQQFKPDECANFFGHAGYGSD